MSLYPEQPARPRIAVFAHYDFPRADEVALYAALDALAADLGAEYRVFHALVPDPATVAARDRWRFGTGVLAPLFPEVHANDLAHCEATLRARFDALLATMARFSGQSPSELLQRHEVRESFSFARQVRAWHADVVLSWGLDEGALHAFVATALLALPRIVVLPDAFGSHEHGQLLPLHADQAHTIVALGEQVVGDLAARLGPARRAPVVAPVGSLRTAPVREALARALAAPRDPNAPSRGPRAAFVRHACAPAPAVPRRFVVLGTERTGSNMLVGMLDGRTGVACAGEVFNARAIAEGELNWLAGEVRRDPELLRLRRDDPAALLARMHREGAAAGASTCGCKLLYLHAAVDDRIADAFAGDGELRVVHLLRADRLQRWLSLVRARRSDVWFAAAGSEAVRDDEVVVLDAAATASEFALDEQLEERFRALFRTHASLELDYDDLVQRLPAVAQRLAAFLGADLGALAPKSRKTGPSDVAGAIANLAELRASFRGTRWAHLFGDRR